MAGRRGRPLCEQEEAQAEKALSDMERAVNELRQLLDLVEEGVEDDESEP